MTWNKQAFGRVALNNEKKEIIVAVLRTHAKNSMSTDRIEGKGRGLIILFHGGPGTGKTLTAESAAELVELPLYPLTFGDIGTDAETMQKYIESVFYIGHCHASQDISYGCGS